jgi:glycosyltransferase involved in cell wall biosynthesis
VGEAAATPMSSEAGELETVPVVVVIASYRRPAYLMRALRSVSSQRKVRPLETVVVDDGSGDGTAQVASSFGARVIEKKHNEGLSAARNDGIRLATGAAQWVALLDDDDEWLPDHLFTLWSNRADHVLVSGTAIVLGSSENSHGARRSSGEILRSPARLLFPQNSVTTSAVMVRRDVLAEVGGFDGHLRYAEDLDAWLRVLERGTGLVVGDVTCLYLQHTRQLSSNRVGMMSANEAILAKYRGRPWLTARLRESVEVVSTWDDLQASRREHRWSEVGRRAAWLLARPNRAADLARLWAFRRQTRRFGRQHSHIASQGTEVPTEVPPPATPAPGLGA